MFCVVWMSAGGAGAVPLAGSFCEGLMTSQPITIMMTRRMAMLRAVRFNAISLTFFQLLSGVSMLAFGSTRPEESATRDEAM